MCEPSGSHGRGCGRAGSAAAVCGVGDVMVAADGRQATVAGGRVLREGETVSVDGDRGLVSRGARTRVPAESDPVLVRFLAWRRAAAA